MISLPELMAFLMLLALIFYCVSGGADFGAGVWDLLSFGPRAADQRRVIEQAIAPVWEANHVWLVFVVVLLFTAFPAAFSAASIALFVPLSAALLGIVARGAGFVFRQYSEDGPTLGRRWGTVFAFASVVTPIFLGVTLAAITSGRIAVIHGVPQSDLRSPWLSLFPFLVGFLVLGLFAFQAAVYLTTETSDPELQNDFRRRAIAAGIIVGVLAFVAKQAAGTGAEHFRRTLLGSWWSLPLQVVTGLVAVTALASLWLRRYRFARVMAVGQMGLVVLGWGLGQRPYLIAPDVTIESAAAPKATLEVLLAIVAAGSILLFPSLYWLFRVFKQPPRKSLG